MTQPISKEEQTRRDNSLVEEAITLFAIETKKDIEEVLGMPLKIEQINELFPKLQKRINDLEKGKKKITESSKPPDIRLPPISPITERIKSLDNMLKLYRGKKYLGLPVSTLKEFNEKMKGLRKLILLAAAPNTGKTAMTIQLGIEGLLENEDACLVYISLEMTSEEILTRMNLYLSELIYDTFVLGKEQIEGEKGKEPLFTDEEIRKINLASNKLKEIGDRLQILDSNTFPNITSEAVISYIEQLKKTTTCKRVIVVVDYLQVWPSTITNEIQADQGRIGEMKKIRDAINKTDQNPIIVISEARKPSSSDEIWGGGLSDVMGSARGTYTPDIVLLLTEATDKQLKNLWEEKQLPKITFVDNDNYYQKNSEDSPNIRGFLNHHGINICNLKMPKGRDGTKRFNSVLAFHFQKNIFAPINWSDIRMLVTEYEKAQKK